MHHVFSCALPVLSEFLFCRENHGSEAIARGFDSPTSEAERIAMLKRLSAAVAARTADLVATMIEEYGAPSAFTGFAVAHAASVFLDMAETLEGYPLRRTISRAEVEMRPSGIAAGCTI